MEKRRVGLLIFVGVVVVAMLILSACGEQKAEIEVQGAGDQEGGESEPQTGDAAQTAYGDVKQSGTTTSKQVQASDEVKALLAKHSSVKSFKTIVDDGELDTFTIIVYGDKIKKTVPFTRYYDKKTFANDVYIDRAAKTAYGLCSDNFHCDKDRRINAEKQDYDKVNPVTPLDIIKGVSSAEKISEEMFDRKQTMVIEYTNAAGKRERLWVDKFSGLPVQQKIYEGESVAEEHAFTEMAVNAYSEEDASLPEGTNW